MTLLFPLARWLCWSQVFTNNELTQTIKTYFYIFQSNIPHFRSMQSSKWWEFLYNLPTFHNRTNSLTKILSNHVQISNEHIQHSVLSHYKVLLDICGLLFEKIITTVFSMKQGTLLNRASSKQQEDQLFQTTLIFGKISLRTRLSCAMLNNLLYTNQVLHVIDRSFFDPNVTN